MNAELPKTAGQRGRIEIMGGRSYAHIGPEERLLARTEKTDTCWLWRGAIAANGYGRIHLGSRTTGDLRAYLPHRVAHELWIGPIPEGYQVDHLCRVRHCINPDHLEAVVPKVNVARALPYRSLPTRTKCGNGHDLGKYGYTSARRGNCQGCRQCDRDRYQRQKDTKNAQARARYAERGRANRRVA